MTDSSNAPTDRARISNESTENENRSAYAEACAGAAQAAGLVGLVLVSHSARLAAGLRDLLDPLGAGLVRVVPAGGLDDAPTTDAAAGNGAGSDAAGSGPGTLGTSYDRIEAAVAAADTGAGVLLLPDLGSAVLTARLVLADLNRDDVMLVDAPFVEGGVAAVVAASTGASLSDVAAAAREARTVPKF